MTKDFNNLAFRLLSVLGIFRNMTDTLMSGHGLAVLGLRDEDIKRNLRIIRHQKAEVIAALEGTDHFRNSMTDNLTDFRLRSLSPRLR